ncbi:hypothetical protein [Bacillus kexueae]|uniref:hypothetical protein n=1 Tax=Aeribacillus kexueae TaxID=2078952 RepID=UPI001FAFD204|nr:hypothetical protein [Bacillus kexueae]
MGTLMLFQHDQEVTAIENVSEEILQHVKQDSDTKKVILTLDDKEVEYENVTHVKYEEDVNWDFGY